MQSKYHVNVSVILIIIVSALLTGCAQQPKRYATSQSFRDTRLLETSLRRGVSTVEDVRKILGDPAGRGEFFSAAINPYPWVAWFYDEVEVTDFEIQRDYMEMTFREQILLVFFRDNYYQGFMWFSNSDDANAWVRGQFIQ